MSHGCGVPAGIACGVVGGSPDHHHARQTAVVNAPSITPFTSNLGYNGEASIAPDNQTIAYVSDRTGSFEIFLRQVGSAADIPLTPAG